MAYYVHQIQQGEAYINQESGGFGPMPTRESARILCTGIGIRIIDKPAYVNQDPRKVEHQEDGSHEPG